MSVPAIEDFADIAQRLKEREQEAAKEKTEDQASHSHWGQTESTIIPLVYRDGNWHTEEQLSIGETAWGGDNCC